MYRFKLPAQKKKHHISLERVVLCCAAQCTDESEDEKRETRPRSYYGRKSWLDEK